MTNNIKCPSCGHVFDVENALATDIEIRLKAEYTKRNDHAMKLVEEERNKIAAEMQLFEEKKKNQNEIFAQRIQQEKIKMQSEMQEQLKKTIAADFENQLKMMEQQCSENDQKLKDARKKELEYFQKEKELKNKEADMELTLQKKLQEERQTLGEQIRQQEIQKNAMKEHEQLMRMRELEKQLEDQKKLAQEALRKAEQGSMQLQGEAQELMLEKMLREHFPFDSIQEVGKGVEGADCVQVVRNSLGTDCGKIIYESKRTKVWNNAWIDKLKNDMRSKGADVAILVTQTFPKDMVKFGERDGVWICGFTEVTSVSALIRNGVLKVYEIQRSEENKGDKMHMLYNYLTGVEFRGQMEAIVEGFMSLKNGITRERLQMEKIWKEREKQLDKVLISTSGMYGSVKGIAGASVADIPLLENGEDPLLEFS